MIKLEKLEKGEFFEDAFLVSYRYNKDYLNKMRSLKYKRYVPDKKAWEIPSSELKHLVDLFGVDDINVNAKYLEGLVEKEESKAEEAPEDIKERLKDIKPIVDYPFKTKPFPHQIEAFNRGYECKDLLLADDQGLGKTKESIDIAVARKGEIGKCLIVCGVNSVKYNWKKEVSVHSNESCVVIDGKTVDKRIQQIDQWLYGRNCGKSIFSGKIYCAKCGAKYWRSLENGYVKFKCSSYSKYGKIPGKGCDNKSFSENALYSILQSLSEQIVEVNTAEVRKSLLNWLESLRERLRASQGDDTIKEEIRKQTARKEKLTDAYMDGIISKEDYSKRYKELEKTLEDLKDKLLTLEVNEDLQSIEEVIQNIDKEMEEYLQTQSFNESRVEFLNQHLTKVTVNKDSFLLEFDLIGGAILTGKDFYLFVDNPRGNRKSSKGFVRCTGSLVCDCNLWK